MFSISRSMKQYTHTLSGPGPEVSIDLVQPIYFDQVSYEVGLKSLYTSNSIPNITQYNNTVVFREPSTRKEIFTIELESGSYEIKEILSILQLSFQNEAKKRISLVKPGKFKPSITKPHNEATIMEDSLPESSDGALLLKKDEKKRYQFNISLHVPTMRVKLFSNLLVDFSCKNSLASTLGFEAKVLEQDKAHHSDYTVLVQAINVIRVECNIACGAVLNGVQTHSIYDFYPSVGYGYKIVEHPTPIIYYPIAAQSVNSISICLVDQSGRRIELQEEQVFVSLHIRPCQ